VACALQIAFLPPLESMTQALIKVLDVTSKTANIHEVKSFAEYTTVICSNLIRGLPM